MVRNLRAAGLTRAAFKDSIVIAQHDVRQLTPRLRPAGAAGRACNATRRDLFQPALEGVRVGADQSDPLLLALYAQMGRPLRRFSGWRAACFVANSHFVGAFGHSPIMMKPGSNAELRGTILVYQW